MLVVFGPGLYHLARAQWTEWRLDRTLASLATRHEQLVQERVQLTSDPLYVEGLIRSTFKVARPGELVIPRKVQQAHGAKVR